MPFVAYLVINRHYGIIIAPQYKNFVCVDRKHYVISTIIEAMKKLLFAAAAVTAVLSFSNAEAKSPNGTDIHDFYVNGQVQVNNITHDMLLSRNLWKVENRNRNQKQNWYTVNRNGENIVVKLKDNDYKTFAKVRTNGNREFVKDIHPAKRDRHAGKIREDHVRYVARDVVRENGTEIIRIK